MKSYIIKKGHNIKIKGVTTLNIYNTNDPEYVSFHPARLK